MGLATGPKNAQGQSQAQGCISFGPLDQANGLFLPQHILMQCFIYLFHIFLDVGCVSFCYAFRDGVGWAWGVALLGLAWARAHGPFPMAMSTTHGHDLGPWPWAQSVGPEAHFPNVGYIVSQKICKTKNRFNLFQISLYPCNTPNTCSFLEYYYFSLLSGVSPRTVFALRGSGG